MPTFVYDLNPVQNIIADAMGEPGKRTFFLQGRSGSQLVSLVLEKQEVGNLAISILQLLEELEHTYPKLKRTSPSKRTPKSEHPMDPYFRVGQLSIGYNEEDD